MVKRPASPVSLFLFGKHYISYIYMGNNKKHDIGTKSLKMSADTLLGMNKGMDKEIIRSMRETLSKIAEKSGETDILKVLDSMSVTLAGVKDDQIRMIVLSNLLAGFSLSMQMLFVREHEKLIREAAKRNFMKNMNDNQGMIDRLLDIKFGEIL